MDCAVVLIRKKIFRCCGNCLYTGLFIIGQYVDNFFSLFPRCEGSFFAELERQLLVNQKEIMHFVVKFRIPVFAIILDSVWLDFSFFKYLVDCAVADGPSVMDNEMLSWHYGAAQVMVRNDRPCLALIDVPAEVSVLKGGRKLAQV